MAVHSLVVVGEVARYVDAIGAGHAVFAGGAGNGGEARHLVGDIGQQLVLGLGTHLQRRESLDVLLDVLHTVHAAQRGQDVGVGAYPAESPARRAVVRTDSLQLVGQFLSHTAEGTAA